MLSVRGLRKSVFQKHDLLSRVMLTIKYELCGHEVTSAVPMHFFVVRILKDQCINCPFQVADILRNLDLSQNRIKEVPPFIGNFNALKQLHLSVNLIDRLPDEIGFLKSLETLSINGNQLTELPESLTQLSSLKTLNASANRLSRFPTVVCQLTQLEVLDLSENQIESIPDEVSNTE